MWQINWTDSAKKDFKKLDSKLQKDIIKYLKDRIVKSDDPRQFGKPLSYDKYGLWCYRVQKARIICCIEDDALIVIVVKVGYRKDVDI